MRQKNLIIPKNLQNLSVVVNVFGKLKKMEDNTTLEDVLLVRNRNAELLRLLVANFDSKVASLRRMRKKNFQNLFVVVDMFGKLKKSETTQRGKMSY